MGLRDGLETLDQAVLEQFERLTQKANRELGWTKYDLKRVADSASGLSLGVAGVYSILTGIFGAPVYSGTQFELQTPLVVVTGALTLLEAYNFPKQSRKANDSSEKVELEHALHGEAMASPNSPYRPLSFMIPVLFLGFGGNVSRGTEIPFPDGTITSAPVLFQLLGLYCYGMSGAFLFQTCSSYLSDTTMTPPATKKSFWKTLYQRAAAALMPKPQPEKVPVPTIDYSTPTEVKA